MAQTVPVMLPIPRVALANKRRVPKPDPERLCLLDEVPLMVRAPTPDEAPIALVAKGEPYRAHEGAFYRPLFSVWREGCMPEAAAAVLRSRTLAKFDGVREDHPFRNRGERLVDVDAAFETADRNRGLRTMEGHQVRQVFDDGLAAQRALADATAANLILVDGQLWHRAPMPVYRIEQQGRTCDASFGSCTTSAFVDMPHLDEVNGRPSRNRQGQRTDFFVGPWLIFAADEADRMAAFAKALCEAPWHGRGDVLKGGVKGLEIVDGSALDAGRPVRDAAAFLSKATACFLEGTGERLSGMPDDVVLAFVEARRAVADLAAGRVDADAAYARIRPYVAGVDAHLAPGVLDQATKYERLEDAEVVHGARALMLRYERFESPNPDLHAAAAPDEDHLALGSLAL